MSDRRGKYTRGSSGSSFEDMAISRVILFLTMLAVIFLFGMYRALTS